MFFFQCFIKPFQLIRVGIIQCCHYVKRRGLSNTCGEQWPFRIHILYNVIEIACDIVPSMGYACLTLYIILKLIVCLTNFDHH